MEKLKVLTENAEKEVELEDNQEYCYNCEKVVNDTIPTEDSAVNFCVKCRNTYYCLKCGYALREGEIMYHKECMPSDVKLIEGF